jgi:hypothetical protein
MKLTTGWKVTCPVTSFWIRTLRLIYVITSQNDRICSTHGRNNVGQKRKASPMHRWKATVNIQFWKRCKNVNWTDLAQNWNYSWGNMYKTTTFWEVTPCSVQSFLREVLPPLDPEKWRPWVLPKPDHKISRPRSYYSPGCYLNTASCGGKFCTLHRVSIVVRWSITWGCCSLKLMESWAFSWSTPNMVFPTSHTSLVLIFII